jgi:integrase
VNVSYVCDGEIMANKIKTRQRDGRTYFYTLLNGKQHGLGFDEREAKKLFRALHNARANAELPDYTHGKLCELYLVRASTFYRKGGVETSEVHCIRSALSFLPANEFARDFGPLALKAVQQSMIAKGLALKTINSYVERIRRMFKWAVSEQLISGAQLTELRSVDGLRAGRSGAREPDAIMPVPQAMLDAVRPELNEVVRDMIDVQLLTGMRSGELCAFKAEHVEMTGPVWKYTVPELINKSAHKDATRVVFIGTEAQKLLRYWLLCGFPYTPTSYRRKITRTCDRVFPAPDNLAGDELERWRRTHRFHPHQLRHNFATKVREKFGLEHAQVALGHASADVTQIYALRNERLAAEVALAVG